jgi:phage terminase small subunit
MENGKKETKKKSTQKSSKKGNAKKSTVTSLTPQQEKFVNGLYMGLSQREAYKAAYNCENMKDNVIDAKASALAKQDKIMVRLEKLQEHFQVIMENRLNVNKEWVMKRLIDIADSNILDLLEIEEEEFFAGVDKTNFTPIMKKYGTVRILPSNGIAKTKYNAVSGIKQGRHGVEIKFYDKTKAIELIGKELGMFKDHVENENINMSYEEYVEKCAEEAKQKAAEEKDV